MKDHLHRTICRYGCHLSFSLNLSGLRWSAGQGIQYGDQEATEDMMRSGTGPPLNIIGWRTLITPIGLTQHIPLHILVYRM